MLGNIYDKAQKPVLQLWAHTMWVSKETRKPVWQSVWGTNNEWQDVTQWLKHFSELERFCLYCSSVCSATQRLCMCKYLLNKFVFGIITNIILAEWSFLLCFLKACRVATNWMFKYSPEKVMLWLQRCWKLQFNMFELMIWFRSQESTMEFACGFVYVPPVSQKDSRVNANAIKRSGVDIKHSQTSKKDLNVAYCTSLCPLCGFLSYQCVASG